MTIRQLQLLQNAAARTPETQNLSILYQSPGPYTSFQLLLGLILK